MSIQETSGLGEFVDKINELASAAKGFSAGVFDMQNITEGAPDKVPLLWSHNDGKPVDIKPLVEAFRFRPERIKGQAKCETLAAFVDLVNRHKSAHTAIFGQTAFPDARLTAVIDYHQTDHVPAWAAHRIVYPFPFTEEFKAWKKADGETMSQFEFAHFIEDHIAEVSAPLDAERGEYERLFSERFALPNELIDLARSLEIHVNSRVKNAMRMKNGEGSIVFETEHVNGKGETVDIPGVFMVSVPAWIDGDPIRVPARLRYRVSDGTLKWSFAMYRLDKWLRDQILNDLGFASKETQCPAFLATPEQ